MYTIERFGFKDRPEELMEIWGEMAIKEYRDNVYIKDGVAEYLEFLYNKGICMGVATASNEELFIPCLKHNNILQYFHSFTTVNEAGKSKESAEVYLMAAKKMGLTSEECAVFEDLPLGLNSANRAGFYTVAIPDNFSKESHERLNLEVKCICDDFKGENIRKLFD